MEEQSQFLCVHFAVGAFGFMHWLCGYWNTPECVVCPVVFNDVLFFVVDGDVRVLGDGHIDACEDCSAVAITCLSCQEEWRLY